MKRIKKNKQKIKRGVLIGVGLASLVKAKAEKTIRNLIKKKNINRKHAKLLVKKVINRVRNNKQLSKHISILEKKVVKKAITKGTAIAKAALTAGLRELKNQQKKKRRK